MLVWTQLQVSVWCLQVGQPRKLVSLALFCKPRKAVAVRVVANAVYNTPRDKSPAPMSSAVLKSLSSKPRGASPMRSTYSGNYEPYASEIESPLAAWGDRRSDLAAAAANEQRGKRHGPFRHAFCKFGCEYQAGLLVSNTAHHPRTASLVSFISSSGNNRAGLPSSAGGSRPAFPSQRPETAAKLRSLAKHPSAEAERQAKPAWADLPVAPASKAAVKERVESITGPERRQTSSRPGLMLCVTH